MLTDLICQILQNTGCPFPWWRGNAAKSFERHWFQIYTSRWYVLAISIAQDARCLLKILHILIFISIDQGARYLVEEPYIVQKRMQFLTNWKRLHDEGAKFVYQDETWTFKHGTGKTKEWQDDKRESCSVRHVSTGDRYIICHAGGNEGFVNGASLFLCSSKKPKVYDDYHGDMNAELFMKWVTEKLLPNLTEPSIIVIDNASYHSVRVCILPYLF